MKSLSLTRTLAVVIALGLAAALTGYDASPAFAQKTEKTEKATKAAKTDKATKAAKTDKATKAQKEKKPAQGCEGMDKATKAYSDCVKGQAQTTQDTRKADQATKKAEQTTKKEGKKAKTK